MRKTILFLTVGIFMSFSAMAGVSRGTSSDYLSLPIKKASPTTQSPARPKSPENNPFWAELDENTVYLGCKNTSFGTVTVTLTSTAGDNYVTSFDTTDGMILLPISGETGYYLLTISTASGQEYYGEFYL